MPIRRTLAVLLTLLLVALMPGVALARSAGTISGTVPLRGMNVPLMAALPGDRQPVRLGSARSGAGGAFAVHYKHARPGQVTYLLATRPGGAAEAGYPIYGQSYRLAAALGEGPVPRRATVNERTTVAMGFAMAQFIGVGGAVVGQNPGLRNAAAMSGDLVGRDGGNVTLLKPSGEPVSGSPIAGAGLHNPWGIAVDGADQVWVANFGRQRLSELCGTEPRRCPPGKRRPGAAISPKSGYGFDRLVRNTGVAIDPSGNVWLADNWKNAPIQTNPGGYQIVAYRDLAAPTRSPQIEPPESP